MWVRAVGAMGPKNGLCKIPSSNSRSINTAKAKIALLLLGGLAIVQKEEISHQVVKYTQFSYGGYCFSNHMYPGMIR